MVFGVLKGAGVMGAARGFQGFVFGRGGITSEKIFQIFFEMPVIFSGVSRSLS